VIRLIWVLVVLLFPVVLFVGIGLLTFLVVHGALLLLIPALVLAPGFLFRRQRPSARPPDSGGGWGNGPPEPHDLPNVPGGGVPLPDAEPARVRLRDQHRPRHVPARTRRPAREPERQPVRSSHRP
jgi:hypothetical protein